MKDCQWFAARTRSSPLLTGSVLSSPCTLPAQLPSASEPQAAVSFKLGLCVLTSHMRLLINTAAVPGGQKLKIIILVIHKPSLNPWAGSALSFSMQSGTFHSVFSLSSHPQTADKSHWRASGKLMCLWGGEPGSPYALSSYTGFH